MAPKVALITGGSQGLGAAICDVFCAQGYQVVLGDIQVDKAQQRAEQMQLQGHACQALELDVADELSVQTAMQQIAQSYRQLDIVVNNAGVDVTKPVLELSSAEWNRVIDVNLSGPFLVSKLALASMSHRGSGHIINIASTAATRGWPNASAYHASKWGLVGFSRGLFTEARLFGVKVTVVIAGGMTTPFILDRFPDVDQRTLQDPHAVAQLLTSVIETDAALVVPELMVLPMMETSWP